MSLYFPFSQGSQGKLSQGSQTKEVKAKETQESNRALAQILVKALVLFKVIGSEKLGTMSQSARALGPSSLGSLGPGL